MSEENGVTIRLEDFTVHYTDSHPDSQNHQVQTTLRKKWGAVVSADIVVTVIGDSQQKADFPN